MPRSAALAVLGGVAVALALPPWGFWPLAFLGVALFEIALGEHPTGRQRLARGWLFGAGWMYPGMAWMWFLTAPGYLVAAAMFAGLHALAAYAAPTGRWRVIGRPAAHLIVEAIRFVVPFGGVPLASLAIGQAGGPFAGAVRVGGALLLSWFVLQVGFALAGPSPFVPRMARRRGATAKAEPHGAVALAVALLVVALAALAPDGTGGAGGRTLHVTAVQGGGPQGTSAIDTSSRDVLDRHLAATRTIAPGSTDLVVWPENVIDVPVLEGSAELALVVAEARRIRAPFAVGITDDVPGNRFANAQVIVTPDGEVVSRYDKVVRVPFGEYMPLRGLSEALGAPTDQVPRDARPGEGPAVLDVPNGPRLGVVISWEVFFGRRADDGVDRGAELIINPTNGSSYTWTILQTQQVASSRLRAIEQGRWVVQVAPTGFSAFITPDGEVLDRTAVSEQSVIRRTVSLATERTWYGRIGDLPIVLLGIAVLAWSWRERGRAAWVARRAGPL